MPPESSRGSRGPAWALATAFGIGHAPFASGTLATIAAVPLHLLVWRLGGSTATGLAALLLASAGIAAAGAMQTRLGYHDPSEVVIDEVAGYFVTMLFVAPTPWTVAGGFVLFRALDVLKPWPVNLTEKLPGGWCIMADDLTCGLLCSAALHVGLVLWK